MLRRLLIIVPLVLALILASLFLPARRVTIEGIGRLSFETSVGSQAAYASPDQVTNSPTDSTGGWTNPTNAYADGTNYASITSGNPSASHTYSGYEFSLTGNTISEVRVRYDAWSAGASITQEYEYYDTGEDSGGGGAWSSYKLCQTFSSSTGFTITSVRLLMYYGGNTTYPNVTVGIYATTGSPAYPTGSALTSRTVNASTLPTSAQWVEWVFSSPYVLNANTTYAIVLSGTAGNSQPVYWRCDASSPTYNNGMYGRSSSGGAWGTSYMDNTKDDMFRTYGSGTEYNDQIRVDVSWDGGTSWSSQATQTLTNSETIYWYDVTSATTWTPEKLDNNHFRVRVDAYTQNTAEEIRLDWIPVEVTYTTGGVPSLTNSPPNKDFDIVQPNTTYYAKGSAPSNPVQDGDCTFTITNDGSIAIDISIRATNFIGSPSGDWILGTPDATHARLTAYYSGQNPASGLVLTTSAQAFYSNLAASAMKMWDFEFETATSFADGNPKTSTITLTATAH